VCAILQDGFFEEARSRLIWAASTADACNKLGFEVKLIANASNTNIPFTKSPSWVIHELKSFYGVDNLELIPLFNPNKYFTKDNDQFVYDYLFPIYVLPFIDLLHSRDPRAVMKALSNGKKVILEDHDEDIQVNSRKQLVASMSHDNFKLLVCITEKVRVDYLTLGAPENKLRVYDSGVNFLEYERVSEIVRKFDSSTRVTLGYAGGLQPERDIDNLIKVASDNPHVDFIFIGGRVKLVDQLIAKANDAGAFNVEFLGYLKFSDMRKILSKKCDGFLYTRAEGVHELNTSPLKLFDYFNYNKPIICAEIVSTKEYTNYDGIFSYIPSCARTLDTAVKNCVNYITEGRSLDSRAYSLAKTKSWPVRQKSIFTDSGLL
jgi:glycosyltransferase involved in cell wall biosynthesis